MCVCVCVFVCVTEEWGIEGNGAVGRLSERKKGREKERERERERVCVCVSKE